MTLEAQRKEAKFLDSRIDDSTARLLMKWNLAILGAALVHDGDHIMQAIRWKYRIPIHTLVINLVVYVLPTVTTFLLKNRRSSSYMTLAASGAVTSAGFLKVHFVGDTLGLWGIWDNSYFKLMKGVVVDGKLFKGITWYDWALLLDLPAISAPAIKTALEKRKEHKQQLEAAE